MITKDQRRIISGFYSTEEERRACLTEDQWKQLEREISERDTGTKEIVMGVNRCYVVIPPSLKEIPVGSSMAIRLYSFYQKLVDYSAQDVKSNLA